MNNQTVDEYVNADQSLKLLEDDKNTDANKSDKGFPNVCGNGALKSLKGCTFYKDNYTNKISFFI